MIIKHTGINIRPEDPFEEDKLDRRDSVTNLTYLVKNISQPFVLSINSPWGTGKTTFIRIWQQVLHNEGINYLHFNAWEHDYFDDPLTSFISEIDSELKNFKIGKAEKGKAKKHIDKAKKAATKIIKRSLPLLLKLITAGILQADDFTEESISEFVKELSEEKINYFESDKKTITEFKKSLQSFANEITKDGNPLVFFIDELDRCRPSYTIALLEKLKHLFTVNGIVFVLSVDRKQIFNSIKSLYGAEIDCDGYLRRFVDLNFNLPQADSTKFIKFLFEKYGLKKVFAQRPVSEHEAENFLQTFISLSNILRLSSRIQEQCDTAPKKWTLNYAHFLYSRCSYSAGLW